MNKNSSSQYADIKPFEIAIAEEELEDLRDRLARTRWPSEPAGSGWESGVPVDYLESLADYWRSGYDWRAQEASLNAIPQFQTTIDGQPVHFLHLCSPREGALPLLLLHGWPGSIAGFLDLIGPLSDPAAHGSEESPAFDLVVPSLPGFGFSGPTRETGWTTRRISAAMAELMRRLGYERYGVKGEDWGAIIGPDLGRIDADHIVGVHVNAATVGFIPFGPVDPDELAAFSEADKAALERLLATTGGPGNGYFEIQAQRPQTLAYGLTDSPAGQLAWIVEKFKEWNHGSRLPDKAIERDKLLTNVMLYWLTRTAGSSARLYYETARDETLDLRPASTPTGVAVFAEDYAVRPFAERFNKVVHWSQFDRGGHFAAFEVPDLLVRDIRAFFGSLG